MRLGMCMRYFGLVVPQCLALLAPGPAAAFDDGGVVPYHPWDDETITINLHQHKGRYVELLLPSEWEVGLTAQERRTFIDRADITYQYYKEIMQAEPRPPSRPSIGMFRIAVNPYVPSSYVAWTQIGVKEMEIRSDADVLAIFKGELAAGLETNRQIMVHEIGHAFDIYAGYLEYEATCMPGTTNWCHAWTDIWDAFIPYYGRVSGIRETVPSPDLDLTADAHQRWWTDHSYLPYYRNLSANWENAVKVEGFLPTITARDSWAGIMDRYVQLYGVETMPKVMAYLKSYVAAHPVAPATPEGKEYLHIAAMADAAHANLSCFLDEWRWLTDEGLADEMELLYGPAANNVLCHDVDGDGYSPLQGDCNDAAASVHPGVTETMNGIDDDCNGLVDDVTPPPPVPVPLAPWAALAAPVKDGVAYVLASSKLTLAAPIVNGTPTQIRFWVTGVGVVATVPYADEASFRWTPTVDLHAGTYGYRAQLLSAGKPVSDFTPLRWFDYGGSCIASSECEDGNPCTVDVCTASGLCSNTLVTDDVYEAETMSHSTGNAYPGGWNIYSNGYISFNHAFAGGLQSMTVRAAGQNGFGWPNMRVTVGGMQVFNGLVETTAWKDFTFSFSTAPVSSEVRVYFTNDFYSNPVDRNLLVDKVTLAAKCGPGGTPTPINLGPLNQQTTFTVNGTQALVIDQLTFSGWTPTRIVVGIGHTDTRTLDGVTVSVSGGATTALTGDWQTISIPFTGQPVINLTMTSATSHALRIQWWAQ